MYLLEIFDGRLSINDITDMELRILIEMKNIQEEKLEKEAKRIAAIQKLQQNGGKNSNVYEGIPPHLQGMP